jgi:hypothetical protein
MLTLAPIALDEGAGGRAGAGRIRSDPSSTSQALRLDPPSGSLVLPEDLRLAFEPVEGYQAFRFTVERGWGKTVFEARTRSNTITVPGSALAPGQTYHWFVHTLDEDRPGLRGGAVFFTLGEEESLARAQIVEQIQVSKDPSLMILLASIDRALGLERQACEDLSGVAEGLAHPDLLRQAERTLDCPQAASEPL